MTKSSIFIASSTFAGPGEGAMKILEESGFSWVRNSTGKRLSPTELVAMGKECQASIAGLELYDSYVFEHWPNLKCISRCGVGTDTIDVSIAKVKNVRIFNTPDVVINPVAEMTIALMLDLLKGISRQSALVHSGKWERIIGEEIHGKTVGIIGLGRIGRRVAQLAGALGAKVCAYDIATDRVWTEKHGVKILSLDALITECDILTLHCAPHPDAQLRLSDEHFSKMKKGSYLINVSRGNFVDEGALHRFITQGHIAGAALDVFEHEPYQGPLMGLANVILTPHVATFTRQSRQAMEVQAVMQAIDFLKNS